MRHSTLYTFIFAAAVCAVCGVLVSSAAVSLQERQQTNAALEKQKNVLKAAGLMQAGESLTAEQVAERFQPIDAVLVDLETGERVDDGVDPASFDQQRAKQDPERSRPAPPNDSAITRLPNRALVYEVRGEGGELEMVVLPIEGLGLWGTLYGFLALDSDTTTIRGIAYYQHKETPGLGGEVDNPSWRSKWIGRKAFDESWQPEIEVIKGQAGPPSEDPHEVDGLSGATLTGRGVTNMLDFWLGENGFAPYLESIRENRSMT